MIFFDMETTGLTDKHEVLSISWCVAETLQGAKEGIYPIKTRYYYSSKDNVSPRAIEVNGLTEEVIKERRGNADYPKHFKDDTELHKELKKLNDDENIFIAHNLGFDKKFLSFEIENGFCTMLSTQYELNLPPRGNRTTPKYPKLSEACIFYGLKFDEDKAHGSEYDVDRLIALFIKLREEL